METAARRERSARDRILDTASDLFYRDGYHAVGIDTIVARVRRGEDDPVPPLPVEGRPHRRLPRALRTPSTGTGSRARSPRADDPKAKLIAAFDAVARLATSPRCLGCTFQAAASEFPEPEHPGHHVALAHKRRVLERLGGLAREAGLRDPDGLAAQLLLLMDGAWVAARMFGPDNHAHAGRRSRAGADRGARRRQVRSSAAEQPAPGPLE